MGMGGDRQGSMGMGNQGNPMGMSQGSDESIDEFKL
jgi:hypothetical protein